MIRIGRRVIIWQSTLNRTLVFWSWGIRGACVLAYGQL
jgi:hypothetical protein